MWLPWWGDEKRRNAGGTWNRPGWHVPGEVSKETLSDGERAELGLPRTFRVVADPGAAQQLVFEPATKHFDRSFRASEPRFSDAKQATAWLQSRRTAVITALTAVSDSQWAENLVLRGSVLLKTWLGAAAREPGDLDFVVTPASWSINGYLSRQMLIGIATGAQRACAGSPVAFDADRAAIEGIWTYDRVPGLRMMLPWTADGGHSGDLQLDFVFNEHLPADPELTEVSFSSDGPKAVVLAVTPELSLAWKVQWLITDMYPQAKDLYDAVLLAERTPLRYQLLRQVMAAADPAYERLQVTLADIASLDYIDFAAFQADHPDLSAIEQDLLQRLTTALEPTFASAPPPA
jgi:Nucleotidyl transferase AbiEii toxin, Type IV TA system